MIRSIYTATRHPSTTHEQFVRRWRNHAALAMQEAEFWDPIQCYAHGDAVRDRAAFPENDVEIDGLGQIWWHDLGARRASMTSAALRTRIVADGSETFVRTRMRGIVIDEHFVRRTERHLPIRIFSLFRTTGRDRSTAALARWNAWLADALPALRFADIVSGQGQYATSDFDGSVELGFHDLRDAAEGLSHWVEALRQDYPMRTIETGSCLTVVIHQRTLYDRAGY